MTSESGAVIYVVAAGWNEDYGIHGVFSSAELADQLASVLPHSSVDECTIDAPIPYPIGKRRYSVLIRDNGRNVEVKHVWPWDGRGVNDVCVNGPEQRLLMYVWATDEEEARQLVLKQWRAAVVEAEVTRLEAEAQLLKQWENAVAASGEKDAVE